MTTPTVSPEVAAVLRKAAELGPRMLAGRTFQGAFGRTSRYRVIPCWYDPLYGVGNCEWVIQRWDDFTREWRYSAGAIDGFKTRRAAWAVARVMAGARP